MISPDIVVGLVRMAEAFTKAHPEVLEMTDEEFMKCYNKWRYSPTVIEMLKNARAVNNYYANVAENGVDCLDD